MGSPIRRKSFQKSNFDTRVALHVRTGDGFPFDVGIRRINKQHPKLPDVGWIIEPLRNLIKRIPDKNIEVRLFTDSPKYEEILNMLQRKIY